MLEPNVEPEVFDYRHGYLRGLMLWKFDVKSDCLGSWSEGQNGSKKIVGVSAVGTAFSER